MFGRLQHPDQVIFCLRRKPQHLSQPVLVIALPTYRFQLGDDLGAQLLDDVLDMMRMDATFRLVRNMQHGDRTVVFLAQQLKPLHKGEAAGVGEQK